MLVTYGFRQTFHPMCLRYVCKTERVLTMYLKPKYSVTEIYTESGFVFKIYARSGYHNKMLHS